MRDEHDRLALARETAQTIRKLNEVDDRGGGLFGGRCCLVVVGLPAALGLGGCGVGAAAGGGGGGARLGRRLALVAVVVAGGLRGGGWGVA